MGKSCRFIQKKQITERKTKRDILKREKQKAYKTSLKPLLMRGRFPFIRESDGRRDTACAEGNQKAVVEQCVYTHARKQSTPLSLGGVPAESQMNQTRSVSPESLHTSSGELRSEDKAI